MSPSGQDDVVSPQRIDRDRWAHLTFAEQMGNIHGEVARSFAAKRSGDSDRLEGTRARALDLLDATLESVPEDQGHRAREVVRAWEQYVRLVTAEHLDEFCHGES